VKSSSIGEAGTHSYALLVNLHAHTTTNPVHTGIFTVAVIEACDSTRLSQILVSPVTNSVSFEVPIETGTTIQMEITEPTDTTGTSKGD